MTRPFHFELSEALTVGHPLIDADHRHLVDLLNVIALRMADEYCEQWRELIAEFFAAFAGHLEREAKWLKDAGYPDWADHQNAHGAIRIGSERVLYQWSQGRYVGFSKEDILRECFWHFLEDAIREDIKTKSFFEMNPPEPARA